MIASLPTSSQNGMHEVIEWIWKNKFKNKILIDTDQVRFLWLFEASGEIPITKATAIATMVTTTSTIMISKRKQNVVCYQESSHVEACAGNLRYFDDGKRESDVVIVFSLYFILCHSDDVWCSGDVGQEILLYLAGFLLLLFQISKRYFSAPILSSFYSKRCHKSQKGYRHRWLITF